jgi:hypothetical protein
MSSLNPSLHDAQNTSDIIESKWEALGDETKIAACYLAPYVERIGIDVESIADINAEQDQIQELLDAGFIEEISRQAVAQEFVDLHRAEVEEIRKKMDTVPSLSEFSDAERRLLRDFKDEESLTKMKAKSSRYRFKKGFKSFVMLKINPEN